MSELFLRAADLELADSGEVTGRLVPFDIEQEVIDLHPDTGEVQRFIEVFRRGSFLRMIEGLKSRGWTKAVTLNLDHRSDLDGTIGYATHIEERKDGAWASFGLYESLNLDKIKSMLRTSHTGMSVGFIDKAHKSTGSMVERLRVHVAHVAATPTPAYAGAVVASVRSEDFDFEDGPPALAVARPRIDELKATLEVIRAKTFV
jgi:hypothetical protein